MRERERERERKREREKEKERGSTLSSQVLTELLTNSCLFCQSVHTLFEQKVAFIHCSGWNFSSHSTFGGNTAKVRVD